MIPWKRIGIALKAGQKKMTPLLRQVVSAVERRDLEILLESEAAAQLPGSSGVSLAEVVAEADLLIVLGGDGTMLAAARAVGARDVHLLGINLGRLGFLTDVNPADVSGALSTVLSGDYRVRERSRLDITLLEQGEERAAGVVLNDAVISKGRDVGRLIELETRVDGNLVASYSADGLIVSTPTGSTAYNLSAGGPLVDETASALILTPICPHTVSQRPLVLSDDLSVEVRLRSTDDTRLTLDGQLGFALAAGEGIRATRCIRPACFVTTPSYDRFETLRTKLGWGSL